MASPQKKREGKEDSFRSTDGGGGSSSNGNGNGGGAQANGSDGEVRLTVS